jgi:hydrogenase-4 component E
VPALRPVLPTTHEFRAHDDDRVQGKSARRKIMNESFIQTVSMSLVITSVAAVELRKLTIATYAYALQALLIVTLLVSYAAMNPALYWWAGTAFLTKVIFVPWALFWGIPKDDDREPPPIIGFAPSVIIATLLILGFFRLTHLHAGWLAPLAKIPVLQTNLAVAATVFALGIFCVITRRDAIKTVIGLCLLENGVHLSLVSLAPELPETALFGIATEVVVTAWLLIYVITGVRQSFGTTDTFKLNELKR